MASVVVYGSGEWDCVVPAGRCVGGIPHGMTQLVVQPDRDLAPHDNPAH